MRRTVLAKTTISTPWNFDVFIEHSLSILKSYITIYIEFHNAQQFPQYFIECSLIQRFDIDERALVTCYSVITTLDEPAKLG